tara:strand:- start:117 stop:398 length:282 start_codon:yes stop_codon:yes gene_type:complete
MQKHGKKGKNMKLFDKMIITTHFIERYCQRILKLNDHLEYQEVKDMVLEDMIERMTMIEKECFKLLCNSGVVKLTLGHTSQVIIEDNTLITVY